MYPVELFQLIQFLIMMFIAIFLVYGIYRKYKSSGAFVKRVKEKNTFRLAVLYMQGLYSADFLAFEKYKIWKLIRIP